MRIVDFFIIIMFFFCQQLSGQNKNIMFTYQQSKFIYSPGLEFNYYFKEKSGLNLGINFFIFNYEPTQLVNISNHYIIDHNGLHFYNFNIGFCHRFLNYNKFKITASIGGKWSYGPNFKPLYFYEESGHYIYYDAATEGKNNFGIDTGIFSYFQSYIFGIKFSTDNYKFRYVIGWEF